MFGKQRYQVFFFFTEVLSRPIFILGDVFVFSSFRHDQTITSWEHPTEVWPVKSMNGPNSIKNGLSWFISGLIENHYPINSENGEWHWSKRLRDIEEIGNRRSRSEMERGSWGMKGRILRDGMNAPIIFKTTNWFLYNSWLSQRYEDKAIP